MAAASSAGGPRLPPLPPSSRQSISITRARERQRRARWLLTAAVVFHIFAIIVIMGFLQWAISQRLGRPVSLGEALGTLWRYGLTEIVYIGIFVQLAFAIAAGAGAFAFRTGRSQRSTSIIFVGALAVAFSLVFAGGIAGAIGGILSIIAGALGLSAMSRIAPLPLGRPSDLGPWETDPNSTLRR